MQERVFIDVKMLGHATLQNPELKRHNGNTLLTF